MGSTTYHDEFARCPECGNATVGLSKPFAINHAKGCSMPVDQIERGIRDSQQDRRVTELLRKFDLATAELVALGISSAHLVSRVQNP